MSWWGLGVEVLPGGCEADCKNVR